MQRGLAVKKSSALMLDFSHLHSYKCQRGFLEQNADVPVSAELLDNQRGCRWR